MKEGKNVFKQQIDIIIKNVCTKSNGLEWPYIKQQKF